MASVLLVDDEKNIRKGLRAIISRSGSVFTDIDECQGGESALLMISRKHYDLLITDLLMPQMDGIELLAKMEGMENRPYTVILSAHDDFKYAQRAIKYGVKAYLLKPVDRAEMNNILKKAEDEITSRQPDAAEPSAGVLSEFYENQLSLILLNENLPTGEIDKILNACEVDLHKHEYCIWVVNFCETYEAPEKRDINTAMNISLKAQLAQKKLKCYSFTDQKGNIVAICRDKTALQECLEITCGSYSEVYSAGTAGPIRESSEMRASYIRAEYALRYGILNRSDRAVNWSEIPQDGGIPVLPLKSIKNLSGMLDTARKDDLIKLVHQIFDEDEIRKNRLEYLEKLTNTFRDEIVRFLSEQIPHKTDFIREQESGFKQVYEFRDLQEFVLYQLNYIMNLNAALLRIKNSYGSYNEIDLALKYVNEHYGKELSMAEVANRISLNYSYFSLLFKEKTGMNFVEYLKKVRIEKAMQLLKDPELKVYEISGMVGYNNTKHFTTTFREYTGISPSEYRERINV